MGKKIRFVCGAVEDGSRKNCSFDAAFTCAEHLSRQREQTGSRRKLKVRASRRR